MSTNFKHLSGVVLAVLISWAPAQALDLNFNKIKNIAGNLKGLAPMSEKDEIKIGQDVAANLLGAAPLVNNPNLQQYVNRVGYWLAQQTERKKLPWTFGVLDSDNVNAFAAPGGYIFVTMGLMRVLGSEAELAGVLAHEIGHVVEKHHLAALRKSSGLGIAGELASYAVKSQDRALADKLIRASTGLYTKGLDKGDEYAADRFGVVVAARAGYDPYGLLASLQTLERLNAQDSRLALMFKTHPAPRDRLEWLETAMGERLDNYTNQPALEQRLSQYRGE